MTNDLVSFSTDELNANRAGRITQEQVKMLRRRLMSYAGKMILLVVLMFVTAAVIVYLAQFPRSTFFVVVPLVLGVMVLLVEAQWAMLTDARNGQVVDIVGTIQVFNDIQGLDLTVSDQTGHKHVLRAKPQQASLFKEGACYRVFYAPRSTIILSAEEVPCDPPLTSKSTFETV
jgi:hypothetical protein